MIQNLLGIKDGLLIHFRNSDGNVTRRDAGFTSGLISTESPGLPRTRCQRQDGLRTDSRQAGKRPRVVSLPTNQLEEVSSGFFSAVPSSDSPKF